MNSSNNNETPKKLGDDYKIFAKNTIYSIFNSYGNFAISIITSYLLARMISQEEWGVLILATSIILIFTTISTFIPPGLIYAMTFYIPRYRAQNEIEKLRSLIFKAIFLKAVTALIIFLIGLLIFTLFSNFFGIYLENHLVLLFIMLPLIIINTITPLVGTMLRGFNLFKLNLVFLAIKSIITLVPFFWFFFGVNPIEIEHVAIINLASATSIIIVEIIILIKKIPKRVNASEKQLTFKSFITKVVKYGSFLRISTFMGEIWTEGKTQSIGVYEAPEWVAGYNLSRNYTRIAGIFLASFTNPLLFSFSTLDYKTKFDKIVRFFNNILTFSMYIYLLIIGILFLLAEFFLGFIYGEDYLKFSILIQLTLIGNAVSIYGGLYLIFLRTTNKIKQLTYILIIGYPLQIIIFFLGLVNFGIIGMLYIEVIERILMSCVYIYLSVKTMKINLKLSKIIFHYLSFSLSLLISLLLGDLILNNISLQFWSLLNLPLFNQLNFLNVIVFLGSFIGLNILFKTISKSELEYIELLFSKNTFSNRNIRRFLHLLKRLLRN